MTGSDIQTQNKDLKFENTFLCFVSSLKCPFDSIHLLAVGLAVGFWFFFPAKDLEYLNRSITHVKFTCSAPNIP